MDLKTLKLRTNSTERKFQFRFDSIGDKGVIEQIFINKDYDINK